MAPPARPDPRPLLRAGIAAQQRGEHDEARRIYHQVLSSWPRHPHALHLLGTPFDAEGRAEDGVRLIRQALPALDDKPNVHNNLGNALRHAGHMDAARRHCVGRGGAC